MHSYEQHILDYISENPKCTRPHLMAAFPHLNSKTIYRNILKLKARNAIVENKYHEISVTPTDSTISDAWPIHKLLSEFTIGTEITRAYANQDDIALERMLELSRKYSQELGKLLINLTILAAATKQLDLHKAFDSKTPVDKDEFNIEMNQLEQICAALKKFSEQAA